MPGQGEGEEVENGTATVLRKGCESDALQSGDIVGAYDGQSKEPKRTFHWSSLFGPGLLVCLADTDGGGLIVAAQSGDRWGYSLLLLQFALIPVLFLAQELTIRLGIYTRRGHTACIRDFFGPSWAWFACALLIIECVGAMISEMSCIAAVGELWGLHRVASTAAATTLIVSVVVLCSYRQIEKIGVLIGLFELTFVVSMVMLMPSLKTVVKGSMVTHTDPEFIKLIAANMGAAIMPWMIFFQQSAVVARGMRTSADLEEERGQTALGCALTQLIMIGTLVSVAAAHTFKGSDLRSVKDIVAALVPALGANTSKVLVSLGFLGGSLCASFVVALAASWAICEALRMDQQAGALDQGPSTATAAPAFYGCFCLVVGISAVVLMMGIDVVRLNIAVELLDGILIPFALGFLFLLSTSEALPPGVRIVGAHKWLVGCIFSVCTFASLSSIGYAMIMEEFWPRKRYMSL